MEDRVDRKELAAGEAFWRFSLAFYARPGVADALIGLQDRAGRDVNLILLGLWLGATRGTALDAAALASAEAALAPVNAVIAPLRTLRRRLKGSGDHDVEALRRRIAVLELAAERQAQGRLAAMMPGAMRSSATADDGARAAAANLALCLGAAADWPEAAVLRGALAALQRR